MSLLWPGFLLLLGFVPLILAAYILTLRRRRRYALRYSSLFLVREALPKQSRLRRHLPTALFLLGITSLILAFSRPVVSLNVPTGQTMIIMAMDVSLSMCASDIPPNRLSAAKDAALSFIRSHNSRSQIGVVVFAGFAEIIQDPTSDEELLEDAIDRLIPARRTAIGSAILKALDAIAEMDESVAPSDGWTGTEIEVTPLPEGTYAPHIIVLLTDGASNIGPEPLDAARQASERGVRVFTIGFGTENGGPFTLCGGSSRDFFGGGSSSGLGGRFRRGIDEATLIQVADMTGGEYYSASSASELQRVFRNLPISFITRRETLEISALFTALGALLATAAIVLSQVWQPLN
jgi:Ca-activated chloride channel family protein